MERIKTKSTKRKIDAALKAKIALEAWKKRLQDQTARAFESGANRPRKLRRRILWIAKIQKNWNRCK
jgi:hypothetical protein